MCVVSMDLRVDYNLDFAIYSMVMTKKAKFSVEELMEDIRKYQMVDDVRLRSRVSCLMKKWVQSGIIQETFDEFLVVA